jgi:di/tricarboxylate transporter
VIEAVIGRDSILAGEAAGRMALHDRHGVNLIAVSRRGERISRRLRDVVLCPGDVVVLQGPLDILPERPRELGCLPLAERPLRLGSARAAWCRSPSSPRRWSLTALGLVPVAVAFFAAAALIMLSGAAGARSLSAD